MKFLGDGIEGFYFFSEILQNVVPQQVQSIKINLTKNLRKIQMQFPISSAMVDNFIVDKSRFLLKKIFSKEYRLKRYKKHTKVMKISVILLLYIKLA